MNNNNALTAHIIIAHLPAGSGKKRLLYHNYLNQQQYFEDNNNYITILNDDNYCLVRAIIIAIAHCDNDKNLKALLRYKSTLLTKKVLEAVIKCKIENKPSGIEELKKLEIYFKDYQITLLNINSLLNNEPLFVGELSKKFIYISILIMCCFI